MHKYLDQREGNYIYSVGTDMISIWVSVVPVLTDDVPGADWSGRTNFLNSWMCIT